jgi:hypothetical protein
MNVKLLRPPYFVKDWWMVPQLNIGLALKEFIFSKILRGTQKHVNHNVVKVWLAPLAPSQQNEE